jgi:hypothetical protein
VALFEAGAPKRDDAIFQPLHALMEVGWLLIALLIPLAVKLWAQQPFEPSYLPLVLRGAPQTFEALGTSPEGAERSSP